MTDGGSQSETATTVLALTGKQKRALRALAHSLQPVVQVGKLGATDSVSAAVDRALLDHELIKVKVLEASPTDRRVVADELAAATGAHQVGQVGRIVILYRPHPTEPTIAI